MIEMSDASKKWLQFPRSPAEGPPGIRGALLPGDSCQGDGDGCLGDEQQEHEEEEEEATQSHSLLLFTTVAGL